MKAKKAIAFTVFMAAAFFYDLLPVTCSVLLLGSLAEFYRMAEESEKEGGEEIERNGKGRTGNRDKGNDKGAAGSHGGVSAG